VSKVIIAGSRRFPSLDINEYKDWGIHYNKVYPILETLILESKLEITAVVSGKCWGMDELGELWAKNNNISVLSYPADWKKYSRAAGPIRNAQMGEVGDALICICTFGSRGSNNMIDIMKKLGKPHWFKYLV
jgi:hypothetical protein